MKCIMTISDMGQSYDAAIERLAALGIDTHWNKHGICNTKDEDVLIRECRGYDIVIAGNERWGERAISACSDALKLIVRYGIGFDNVDLKAASSYGIPVVVLPGCNADSVAERALALMLAVLHRLPEQHLLMDRGTRKIQPYLTNCLMGKTVGILGLGNIGRAVARFLKPFHCRLIAYDPFPDAAAARENGVALVEQEYLLENADVITLHLPMSESTKWTIRRETIEKMKPSAIVINTSRGGLVCSDDLAQALRDGRIRGAGLDVYENEGDTLMDIGYPFIGLQNAVRTAHTASNSYETFANMMDMAVQVVEQWLGDGLSKGLLNPEYRNAQQAKGKD